MSSDNNRTVFQLGMEAISKIGHPRIHTRAVQTSYEAKTAFLADFKSKVAIAETLAEGETKSRLNALMDDVKFSDPVSTEDAQVIEKELLQMAEELIQAIMKERAVTEESITRTQHLLATRNELCKLSK